MREVRLRTLERVNAEVLMVASGQNVKRLLEFGHRGPRKMAQAAALRPPDGPRSHTARRHPQSTRAYFNRLPHFMRTSLFDAGGEMGRRRHPASGPRLPVETGNRGSEAGLIARRCPQFAGPP